MSRFDRLLDGYLRNDLTENELQEFFDLVRDNPHLDLVRQRSFDESQAGLTTAATRDRMLSNVLARTRPKRIPLWRWSAAAALILSIGSVFLFHHPAQKPIAATVIKKYKNDVLPGRTGATLQLADGSSISLDSVKAGVIATQGNAQVVRQSNGALAYLHKSRDNDPGPQYNKLSTGRGRTFLVVLPDGTRVRLNSSSSISYPTSFSNRERVVQITGEAYLEVARDASRPFIVRTADQRISVLGTSFNVNAYEDEPVKRTTLLQGSIRVSSAGKDVLLTPGQAAASRNNGNELQVAAADVEAAVAWKNGYFQFDNADLPTVMRQLARWYDVDVTYEGPVPAWNDFKGQIGRDLSLAQVLKILEQARVHFRIQEDKRIVIFN
ncbi:MAG TPA: FecR domain-containing protein [Puia sp.]|nr:FecR domain-containing protein [Puia sp.]